MKKILLAVAALVILVSCGRAANAGRAEAAVDVEAPSAGEVARGADPGAPVPEAANPPAVEMRVRVKTGEMTLVVEEVKKAEEAVTALTAAHGGYVALSRIDSGSGSVTVKIPEDRFDAALAAVEKIGQLRHKAIVTEDVSDRYFDLENRIENKRILLGRYQEYLRRASSTKELLQLEAAINGVTAEIEGLEGSYRNLRNAVNYSTLTLSLELPPEKARVLELPSLVFGLRTAGEFLLLFLYYLLLVVVYTLIVAVPLTLVGGFVYYVGFGRIGLVIKFFRLLAPKKNKT